MEVLSMSAEAISKINIEIEKEKSNQYVKVIGEFLIGHLATDPSSAEKIMAKDKTIAGSLTAMQTEAKKKQHGGMAMLTDIEGFAIVLKYYGIEGAASVAPAAPVPKPTADFNVSLDDYL
jgi:hypothetical protein